VSEIIGISDHLGGFLLRRGCPGEKAWFLPRSTPPVGSLTRFVPQLQTPPGLTTSPQASLPACPAVGLSTSEILSDGSDDIEPPRRRAILPEGQGLTRHLIIVRTPNMVFGRQAQPTSWRIESKLLHSSACLAQNQPDKPAAGPYSSRWPVSSCDTGTAVFLVLFARIRVRGMYARIIVPRRASASSTVACGAIAPPIPHLGFPHS